MQAMANDPAVHVLLKPQANEVRAHAGHFKQLFLTCSTHIPKVFPRILWVSW